MKCEDPSPPKPKRRWPHFSLQTALMLSAIVAAGLGWLGMRYREARRQQAVIAEIREKGGLVELRLNTFDTGLLNRVDGVHFGARASVLPRLNELNNLEHLFINNSRIRDLSPLAQLKNLDCLYIAHMPVRDVSQLSQLKHLKYLELINAGVSEDDANRLRKEMPNTRILWDPSDNFPRSP